VNDHPLGFGRFDLPVVGGHFFAALQAGQVHLFAPQPDGAAGAVDGHVSPPQHHHASTQHRGTLDGDRSVRRHAARTLAEAYTWERTTTAMLALFERVTGLRVSL
jgi:hypothetical protein